MTEPAPPPEGEARRSPLGAAGRLAFYPARMAARASRAPLEAAADEHLLPELSRLAERAIAGELPEHLAHSIAEHQVLERMAAELAESGALDAMVDQALASPRTQQLAERIVASPAVQQAIRDVVSSPQVVEAMKEQTAGVADELARDLRASGSRFDDRVEAAVRRRAAAPGRFAGLATRAVGFTIDVVAIAAIFAVLAGVLALVAYLVGGLRPAWLVGTLLGAGALLVAVTYFVVFWSGAGRTPGMHLMGIRVQDASGRPPSPARALVRAIVTWPSITVAFLGYVPVLFDGRRRGLPDIVAGTTVVYATPGSPAQDDGVASDRR